MTPSVEVDEAALRTLARRERSVAEMRIWLTRRGYGTGEVEGCIDRLLAAGALDDDRFARGYARDKRELAGWGPERIRAALAARGLAAHGVEAALAEDPRSPLERAVELLEERGSPLGDDASRQRALQLLVRRGYDLDVAYEAVRSAGAHRAA